jgi:hypothetical protein
MRRRNIEASVELEQRVTLDGKTYLATFRAHGLGYSDPGVTSGPPERCYPPEGEIEVVDISDVEALYIDADGYEHDVTDESLLRRIADALDRESIADALWENAEPIDRGGYE